MRQERNGSVTTAPQVTDVAPLSPKTLAEPPAISPVALNELLEALQAMQAGDFSVRLPGNQTGIAGKIADTFNDIASANQRLPHQLGGVGEVAGKEGRTRQRVSLGADKGAWGEMETSVNTL